MPLGEPASSITYSLFFNMRMPSLCSSFSRPLMLGRLPSYSRLVNTTLVLWWCRGPVAEPLSTQATRQSPAHCAQHQEARAAFGKKRATTDVRCPPHLPSPGGQHSTLAHNLLRINNRCTPLPCGAHRQHITHVPHVGGYQLPST